MMRITHQMMNRNSLSNIQLRQSDLFEAQRQASSGYRYERASQDTVAASQAMDLKQALSFQKRLESNSLLAQDFNNQTDSEMAAVSEVMGRVRELAIRAASEALNEQQINGISSELEGLLERLTDIANTTHEGRYLFGGFQTQQAPFNIEKALDIQGTALTELGLTQGPHRTRVETHSMSTIPGGAFALNAGDLILNGVDLGAFVVNDITRSDEDNAQALVDLINAKTEQTGITARAIQIPGGNFDNPGAAPFNGIALVNLDSAGQPSSTGITVQGNGMSSVTAALPLFRNETLPLSDTRFRGERIATGAIGDVPAGSITINGITLNSNMSFNVLNTNEQNAQEIARAINTIASQSRVYAETDGNGFVQLISQYPFEIAGAPFQIEVPNQVYEQTRDLAASTTTVNSGSTLRLDSQSLLINGIDIFAQPLVLDSSLNGIQRAQAVVQAINQKADATGIGAFTDVNGQIYFSNADRQITAITYRGDSGDNQAQIGSASLVPLYMSGDEAFSGNRNDLSLLSQFDLPAAGMGSAISSANVSFSAGDTLGPGDFVINGIDILVGPLSGVAATDAADLVAAINAQSATSNVSALVNGGGGIELISDDGNLFNLVTNGAGTLAQIPAASYVNALNAGDFIINGVDIGPIGPVPANPTDPAQNMLDLGNALATAINAQSYLTRVTAEVRQDAVTGGTRLFLATQGQDLDISSSSPFANTLLSATGITPGTHIDQRIDVFESVIRLRDQVINSKFGRNPIQTISTLNLKEVSDAVDQIDNQRVELGIRSQRAELVANRVGFTQQILETQLAENREIDLTEVLSRITQQETALQAAYSITQRINSLSLLNYL